MRKIAIFAAFAATISLCSSAANAADCFDQAAAYQGVNVNVLRAIAIVENPRCDATISRNTDGSRDNGCMQINSVHFGELARYGVFPGDLRDQCKNIFVGAWHYKRKIARWGNNWLAVGAYHSETPHLQYSYAQKVIAVLRKYGFK